jgi:hypothetical protein
MALGRPPDDGVDPRNTLPCQTDLQLIANPNIQRLPAGTEPTLTRCTRLSSSRWGSSSATTLSLPLRPVLKWIARTSITREAGGYFQAASHSPFPGDQTRPGGSRPSRTITPSLTKGSGERYQRWRHCATCSMRDTGWVYCPL